ncbi:MAG TPA: hypothetical protein VD993_02945 [Chitinophagaceae bacterium]|nr:hypothetical protein [Chitinophagaceae bacterium]
MDREEMMAASGEKGCCKKELREQNNCKPPAKSCEASEEEQPCKNDTERQCDMQNESTCICIFCFQFAGPDQLGNKFHFGISDSGQSLAIYLQHHWKDPQLALPWQPPDIS